MVSKYDYSCVFSVFQVPFRGMLDPYGDPVKLVEHCIYDIIKDFVSVTTTILFLV